MTKHLPFSRPSGRLASPVFRMASAVLLACALAAGLGAATPVQKDYSIPAGPADAALKQFSVQSGEQLLYSTGAVAGVTTPAVTGHLTAREALDQLGAGTDLTVQQDARPGALAVARRNSATDPAVAAPRPPVAAKG